MAILLLISIFVIAACGLVYELASAAIASYLLGDSVTQFSTVIGVYLFAMGVGSYLAKFVKSGLVAVFIKVELLIGLLGGTSAALLFLVFNYAASFHVVLYLLVFLIGALVGLEIPLLMRILRSKMDFKDLVSNVLSFDYIGALLASVLFPLLFVPQLGLVKTCFFFGILNALIAFVTLLILQDEVRSIRSLKAMSVLVLVTLVFGFAYGDKLLDASESALYTQPIIYSKSSPYQRIVITKSEDDLRLHLNGHLQFSSRDEYRYHEALVHVGLQSVPQPKRVLVLGGGDGLAIREVLKYDSVESVTLVDLDPEITLLFKTTPILATMNQNSLASPKVRIENEDAFLWLRAYVQQEGSQKFDFVIMDFPDPNSYSVGKLYTTTFFNLVRQVLSETGYLAVQSTSPYVARKSFWCVVTTLQTVGFDTLPYHVFVPSFGEWGFVLAGNSGPVRLDTDYLKDLRFISSEVLPSLLQFPSDMQRVDVEANKLNNQVLVRYYDEEWSKYQ